MIIFPLFTIMPQSFVSAKVLSESATLKWVKKYTTIPVPTVVAFDAEGREPWNTTLRPCIITTRLPGKHITNRMWAELTFDQQYVMAAHTARIKAELSMHCFNEIGTLSHPSSGKYVLSSLRSSIILQFCRSNDPCYLDVFKCTEFALSYYNEVYD